MVPLRVVRNKIHSCKDNNNIVVLRSVSYSKHRKYLGLHVVLYIRQTNDIVVG